MKQTNLKHAVWINKPAQSKTARRSLCVTNGTAVSLPTTMAEGFGWLPVCLEIHQNVYNSSYTDESMRSKSDLGLLCPCQSEPA